MSNVIPLSQHVPESTDDSRASLLMSLHHAAECGKTLSKSQRFFALANVDLKTVVAGTDVSAASAKSVLRAVADIGPEQCWACQALLAEMANVSIRTLQRSISALERGEILTVMPQQGRPSVMAINLHALVRYCPKPTQSTYTLERQAAQPAERISIIQLNARQSDAPAPARLVALRDKLAPTDDSLAGHSCQVGVEVELDPKAVEFETKDKSEAEHNETQSDFHLQVSTPNSRRTKKQRHDYSAAFEAFWQSYPVAGRTSKESAYKEYKAAIARLTLNGCKEPGVLLLERVKMYATSPIATKESGKYCTYAMNWLARGKYEDEHVTWGIGTPKSNPAIYDPNAVRKVCEL